VEGRAIYEFVQRPITEVLTKHHLPAKLGFLNPTDPFNLYFLKWRASAGAFS